MKQSKIFLALTLALYILYSLQGILYPTGSLLSQLLLLLFLVTGIYWMFRTISQKSRNPRVVNIWILFFLLLTITYIVSPKEVLGTTYEALGKMSTIGQFKNICFVSLPFFIVYCYAKKGVLTSSFLFYLSIILVIVAVLRYLYSAQLIQEVYTSGFQNNAAYNIIAVLPFMPFVFKKRKILGVFLLLAGIAFILFAAKRGAIVCLIVAMLATVIYLLKHSRMKASRQFAIIGVAVCIGGGMIYLTMNNEFLLDRIEQTLEGNIGTREIAYSVLWNHWLNSNLFVQIFGNGLLQSVSVWGNSAHNDWLELLIDNGVLGVVIYFLFFVSLFNHIRKMTEDSVLQLSTLLAALILLTKSIFSMGYVDFVNVPMVLAMGIGLGMYESEKKSTS